MFYPVQVDGALFSIGDPHISQGDGEISGTAIEGSLDVVFQVFVRRDFSFPSPLLRTASSFMTHGFDEDLNQQCATPRSTCCTCGPSTAG